MVEKIIVYKNFLVANEWEKRVEINSSVLKGDAERAYLFQILLNKRPEIRQIKVTVETGGVIVDFEPENLSKMNLFVAMDAVLNNLYKESRKNLTAQKMPQSGTVDEIALLVEGMSCPACAALIEIALKKDARIEDANADLETKEVIVYGLISKDEVINKIEKLGYKYCVEME